MFPQRRPALAALFALLFATYLIFTLRPAAASLQSTTVSRLTRTAAHSTSLNPTLSGDGRIAVFESTADLAAENSPPQFRTFAADVSNNTNAFVRLAATRAPAAAVSQDGASVAFSSAEDLTGDNADRNPEIFLSTRGALRQLTNTQPADAGARLREGNFRPSISDDGRLVAFSSNCDLAGTNADGNFEIFVLDTVSNSPTQITNSAGTVGATDAKLAGEGSRVAFVRNSSPPSTPDSAPRQLVLHERQTNTSRVVFEGSAALSLTPGRAISDDGLRVAFSDEDSRGASQVYIYDGRNDAVRQLTRLGTRQTDVPLHPSISGDGSRVSFATRLNVNGGNSDASVELYLYDLPTNRLTRVTDAPKEATAEVVSSLDDAGTLVAFNFPRVLAEPVSFAEFSDTSEIFLAHLPSRQPFLADLEIIHGATFGREPSAVKAVAPGQIAVARGSNLSLVTRQSQRLPGGDFPRSFAGVSLAVNGRPAHIFYVSPTQINFQVPDETEIGTAEFVLRNHDGYESRAAFQIATAAPGIFTERGDGTGAAVALDAQTHLRAPFDPVDAANNPVRLALFATGVARARNLSVTIAGRDTPVEAVVPSNDLPGLDEIHVRLRHSLAGAGVVPCIITADGRTSNSASLQFSGTRRAARVTLTPASATIGAGRSVRLTAKVFDGDGIEMADAPVTFTTSDETVASVDSTGLVRGVGAGTATITAASGDVSAVAEVRVFSLTLVINEVLADPPDGAAGDANRDGTRSSSQDEFVEIVNASGADIDLAGYQIATRNSAGADVVRHTFSSGTVLSPGTAAVVFGGAESATFNPSDPAFGGALVLTSSTGGLSLLNGGSTVSLLSPAGALVEQLTYGGASELDGDRNQSLARAPDVTGDFALHQLSTGEAVRSYSPGTKLDGTPFKTSSPVTRVQIIPSEATAQTGASRQFEARAFDETGRELSGVIFRWESRNAAVATVDQIGLASAHAPGTAEIIARARGVESPPALLTVTPPPQRIHAVEISPAAATINRGGSLRFTARALDQQGRPVADATFSWASGNAAVAAVDSEGVARGVGAGSVTLTASTPDGAGGTASATARLDVRVPVVLNELLADVPPDNSATAAVEGDSNRDGVRRSDDDEFIELLNISNDPVDLSGLRVSDSTGVRFTFPAGATLASGRAAVVFGGGTPHAGDPAFGGALVFSAAALSLNDSGDALTLKLPLGADEFVVLSQNYGLTGGPAAPADQSLTRSPDAAVAAAPGDFTPHLSAARAAGRAYSPGTRSDGTPFGSPPVTRIEISPASERIDIGATQSFTARAFGGQPDAESEIQNVSFIWDANDPVKISLAPSTGRSTTATAHGDGSFNVRARVGGAESVAILIVNPPPPVLTWVEIAPPSQNLIVGQTGQLTARAFDQYGQPFAVESISFASGQPEIAAVDSTSFKAGDSSAAAVVSARRAGTAEFRATARAGASSVESNAATVVVNDPPPVLARITVSPADATVGVGATRQFTARAYDQNGRELSGVTFNWSSSDTSVATISDGGLATGANAGTTQIRASASNVTSDHATLKVTPPPVPAAGEVIINEAVVAYATSSTQPRADFVELYNPTGRTLDISGLVVSFRPAGSGNTVRTLTLPGAVGSDTLRINPRGYFIIVNGAQTFGATIQTHGGRPDGYDASTVGGVSNYFDLNNTTGAIKIEIGNVKLDGLAYQGGTTAPAAPFNTYGEGPLLVFTSGATNDLIRNSASGDTGDNSADFRRNGTASLVTPKAANP